MNFMLDILYINLLLFKVIIYILLFFLNTVMKIDNEI